jgi:hypothetical protein
MATMATRTPSSPRSHQARRHLMHAINSLSWTTLCAWRFEQSVYACGQHTWVTQTEHTLGLCNTLFVLSVLHHCRAPSVSVQPTLTPPPSPSRFAHSRHGDRRSHARARTDGALLPEAADDLPEQEASHEYDNALRASLLPPFPLPSLSPHGDRLRRWRDQGSNRNINVT